MIHSHENIRKNGGKGGQNPKRPKKVFCKLKVTTQFSIKDLFRKCDQIRRKLRIWSHLLKKSLMKNLIFCAVNAVH